MDHSTDAAASAEPSQPSTVNRRTPTKEPLSERDDVIDPWEATMARLRERFPGASDGILFCVHKLQSDPQLTIKDFRDEADLYGLALSGRSLHSAKVLLGLEKPAVRRTKEQMHADRTKPERDRPARDSAERASSERAPAARTNAGKAGERTRPGDASRRAGGASSRSVEDSLIAAVQRIQDSATADANRLRTAIRDAIAVLQRALDGRAERR